jgi:hypothetical protein
MLSRGRSPSDNITRARGQHNRCPVSRVSTDLLYTAHALYCFRHSNRRRRRVAAVEERIENGVGRAVQYCPFILVILSCSYTYVIFYLLIIILRLQLSVRDLRAGGYRKPFDPSENVLFLGIAGVDTLQQAAH